MILCVFTISNTHYSVLHISEGKFLIEAICQWSNKRKQHFLHIGGSICNEVKQGRKVECKMFYFRIHDKKQSLYIGIERDDQIGVFVEFSLESGV